MGFINAIISPTYLNVLIQIKLFTSLITAKETSQMEEQNLIWWT